MSYQKFYDAWKNDPSTDTPVSADALNHIEQGIVDASDAVSVEWGDVGGKPSTFTPDVHTHSLSEVDGLSGELGGKANTSHTHTTGEVEGLDDELSAKADYAHTHSLEEVSGTVEGLDGSTLAEILEYIAGRLPASDNDE